MANLARNIPLSLEAELLALIDTAATELNDNRSNVMRKAIRAGLPLVARGGESLRLNGDLSDAVGALAKHYNRTRESILVEAVQKGIGAVEATALLHSPEEKEFPPEVLQLMHNSLPGAHPMRDVVQRAKRERGALQIQLDDLLRHCPGAQERKEVIERHMELYRAQHGSWPSMWGAGVSTEDLKRQIALLQKGNPQSVTPPASEPAAKRRSVKPKA